jgi:hypothetical protein
MLKLVAIQLWIITAGKILRALYICRHPAASQTLSSHLYASPRALSHKWFFSGIHLHAITILYSNVKIKFHENVLALSNNTLSFHGLERRCCKMGPVDRGGVHSYINGQNGRSFFILLDWGAGEMVLKSDIICILSMSSILVLKVQNVYFLTKKTS